MDVKRQWFLQTDIYCEGPGEGGSACPATLASASVQDGLGQRKSGKRVGGSRTHTATSLTQPPTGQLPNSLAGRIIGDPRKITGDDAGQISDDVWLVAQVPGGFSDASHILARPMIRLTQGQWWDFNC